MAPIWLTWTQTRIIKKIDSIPLSTHFLKHVLPEMINYPHPNFDAYPFQVFSFIIQTPSWKQSVEPHILNIMSPSFT